MYKFPYIVLFFAIVYMHMQASENAGKNTLKNSSVTFVRSKPNLNTLLRAKVKQFKTAIDFNAAVSVYLKIERLLKQGATFEEAGIDINSKHVQTGSTLVHFAALFGDDLLPLLRMQGADLNAQTKKRKETPLHVLINYAYITLDERYNRVQQLLSSSLTSIDLDRTNYLGETALHNAARVEGIHFKPCLAYEDFSAEGIIATKLYKFLINRGCKCDVKNIRGITPPNLFLKCCILSNKHYFHNSAYLDKQLELVKDRVSDWDS